jgi:23S rRNA-/tRNA-specific pseudouridylate synthase
VHRLDLGVSGVLVIAKRADVASALKSQFAAHKPQRVYIAIVNGIMQSKSGTFRSHLATDATLNRYSTRTPGKGELAITHYQVLGESRGASIVRVRLETGRRNSLRGQSPTNRPATSRHPKWKARRLALHAYSLEFEHPVSRKAMRFEAGLPAEFEPFTQSVML